MNVLLVLLLKLFINREPVSNGETGFLPPEFRHQQFAVTCFACIYVPVYERMDRTGRQMDKRTDE